MAAFDDSFDPELGDACNRLAAWVEALPAGVVIDEASGLSEDDLALILRRLHATRHLGSEPPSPTRPQAEARTSVPVTARS